MIFDFSQIKNLKLTNTTMPIQIYRSILLTIILSLLTISPVLSIKLTDSIDVKLHAAMWADDRRSAFSFTFDDGFISQYENARPILNAFGFPASFYLMPPFLTDSLPGIWRYGTWSMFLEMAMEGHEIGSHTMTHPALTTLSPGDTSTPGTIMYELYQSRQAIEARVNDSIPGYKCITLAYPFSDRNELVDSLTSLFYEAGRSEGLMPVNHIPDFWFNLSSYLVRFDEPRDSLIHDLEELYTFLNWTSQSILNNQWAMIMLHEMVPQDELGHLISLGSFEPVSNEWFTLLCEWLKEKADEHDVWVETVANVTRYIKQRENFNYDVLASNKQYIELQLTDELDDEIFNYPLSVYVTVPDKWETVLLTQNNRFDTLEVIRTDSGKVVLAGIVPDYGIARLENFITTGIFAEVEIPSAFRLHQNYPNPFNPVTNIRFELPKECLVELSVYNVLGQRVATIIENEFLPAGNYKRVFDGANLSSGVYLIKLTADNQMLVQKAVLMK